MPALLAPIATPRPRRLIPRGAGPASPVGSMAHRSGKSVSNGTSTHVGTASGGGVGTRPGRSVYMPNGLAVSFRRRQPVTGLTYYLLYEPKSYSSSGTASPEPWPKA
jgi:hypothetical protein